MDWPPKRSIPRKLEIMGQRVQSGPHTEQLLGGQHLYNPREDTEHLSFCEKHGSKDGLFGEKHGLNDDYATNDIVRMEKI